MEYIYPLERANVFMYAYVQREAGLVPQQLKPPAEMLDPVSEHWTKP